jgi:purine-binding chemotaxis protein CheW
VSDVFARLRASVQNLELAIGSTEDIERRVSEAVLRERTERIAREPERVEREPDRLVCMAFERCSNRYAVPLATLQDVGVLGAVAHVPGIPDAYLGVTARRGRVVAVIDIPRLFGSLTDAARPTWLVMAASHEVVCGVAADELHDVIELRRDDLTIAMPTFPPLLQRHTLGVLEDRTVVLDLTTLLEDRTLRVEERRG